jgi:hypothetical protein
VEDTFAAGVGERVWMMGGADGVRSRRGDYCAQKFLFATLAMLVAIFILGTHTGRASIGLHPRSTKLVFMTCRCRARSAVRLVLTA